jgi:hypothetical protein
VTDLGRDVIRLESNARQNEDIPPADQNRVVQPRNAGRICVDKASIVRSDTSSS